MEPTIRLTEGAGFTAIETIAGACVVVEETDTGAITGKLTDGLVIPDMAALMLARPAATPVAKPVESIVATALLSLDQVTSEVIFAVDPSEKVPAAKNCVEDPTAKLEGEDGAKAMEINLSAGVDVDADEQAVIIMVNAVINQAARQKPINRICFL